MERGVHGVAQTYADTGVLTMIPIRLSPQVARKMAVEAAIQKLGRKWLLHPANQVQRLSKPFGFNPTRSKQ